MFFGEINFRIIKYNMSSKVNKALLFGKKIRKAPVSLSRIPIQQQQQIQPQNNFTNALLGTQKIEKQHNKISVKELEEHRNKQYKTAINERTNVPYKNILPVEYFNKPIRDEKDLIVYKVTKEDKHTKLLNDNMMNLKTKRHTENVEIENKYNEADKLKHKQIFEQNKIIKCNVNYNQKMDSELKENALVYYENKQKENEQNKQTIDEMIDMLSSKTNIVN